MTFKLSIQGIACREKIITGRFLFWLLAVVYGASAQAQSYPYIVDFETANTSPASKSYASTDTIMMSNVKWVLPGVYLGAMTVNDFKNGVHAARMRLSNNSSGSPGYLEMAEDLPTGIDTLYFQTAMYGSETGGQIMVFYSTSAGATWVAVGDTIDVPEHDSPVLVSRVINQSGPVRIRIEKAENSNVRIDIDDLYMNSFGLPATLSILDWTPIGIDIPPSADSLTISFDQVIDAGAGILTLQQSDGPTQNFAIPSAQVTLSDSTAIFSGIVFTNAASYYVLLSDSAFRTSGGSIYSEAITDSTYWTFTTADTTTTPPIPPFNTLDETFLACNTAQNLMGVFNQFSVQGIQTWSCASDGHQDSFCVRINGGIAAGVSDSNEDWLISSRPFDFSEMSSATLHFWEKSLYGGIASRELKISTDYAGYGDPRAAHWTLLNIPGFDEAPGAAWTLVSGIDLNDFKDMPFYLAFSYRCGSEGAYALYYDDVGVTDATGIEPLQPAHFLLRSIGHASGNAIPILLELDKAQRVDIRVIDLSGRLVYRQGDVSFPAGSNKFIIRPQSLRPGIYLVRVGNGQGKASTKVLVE
jgi:hypothetical protein